VSFVHNKTTLTPEAKSFIAYVQTAKARTVLTDMGGVPATE
jgi:ABC-type molybdate transport system substrate-binding protein